MPTPYQNKTTRNYLVLDGRVTREGYKFLKVMNVYWKADKINKTNKIGLTPEKKLGLKQVMGSYSGKASLSTLLNT